LRHLVGRKKGKGGGGIDLPSIGKKKKKKREKQKFSQWVGLKFFLFKGERKRGHQSGNEKRGEKGKKRKTKKSRPHLKSCRTGRGEGKRDIGAND